MKNKKYLFANSRNGGGILNTKNAFTLIELLAIIVILAIIAVITVPIILNIIENSRKGAASDSVYGYKDSISKYYLGKLSENQNYNDLDGEYTIDSNGYLVENGTVKHQIQVLGQKPSGGTMTIENKIITLACVQMGDYKVSITNGNVSQAEKGSCLSNNNVLTVEPLEIGATVNYSTSLNGVTLDDWKVFLSDSNYTYLIFGDYLPTAAISNSTKTTYDLGIADSLVVYPNKDEDGRDDLINAMSTTANWSDLINNGKINGVNLSSDVKNNTNVWAMGSPDLELWVESWNVSYPSNIIYTRYIDAEDIDNINFFATGYLVGDSANLTTTNPTTTMIDISSKEGYNNTLYFLYHDSMVGDEYCYGYWLATPTANSGNRNIYMAAVDGKIWRGDINDDSGAFRPVIKLPTNVVNQ